MQKAVIKCVGDTRSDRLRRPGLIQRQKGFNMETVVGRWDAGVELRREVLTKEAFAGYAGRLVAPEVMGGAEAQEKDQQRGVIMRWRKRTPRSKNSLKKAR